MPLCTGYEMSALKYFQFDPCLLEHIRGKCSQSLSHYGTQRIDMLINRLWFNRRPKKKIVWLPSTAFFREGRSVGFFFFFFSGSSTRGVQARKLHVWHWMMPTHPPSLACQYSFLHGPLGRSAASAFTTSPATSKSKQSHTSCSDCDILNILRVERRHVDPLFTCTANPTFCSLGAAMIGMSTARNFIWPYSSCNFVIYNCVEKRYFLFKRRFE